LKETARNLMSTEWVWTVYITTDMMCTTAPEN
jgi:hypothetical protein